MNPVTEALARERAGDRCDYCGLFQAQELYIRFHVDHIVAQQHGGGDEFDNLALACFYRNARKGTNLTSIDPETGLVVRLFHPRQQQWHEHFKVRDTLIEGITQTGRATVKLLNMNFVDREHLREV